MSLPGGIIRDLREFDWRELASPHGSGAWPATVKTAVVFLLTASLLAAGYLLRLRDLREQIARLDLEESELTAELHRLARSAGNLDGYRRRAREIEEPYMQMLRQLPYESEIPALIEEVTALRLKSGLQFVSIGLAAELDRPHYVEQPIDIRVNGGYHEIGAFFSGAAALDRIVTMHDFSLRELSAGKLELELSARTYRYRPLPAAPAASGSVLAGEKPAFSPQWRQVEQFAYSAGERRNPFAPLAEPPSSGPGAAPPGPNPLMDYALSELRLVGLLKRGQDYAGLLRDPAGAVHRVARGDHVGAEQGRIRKISDRGVELVAWKIDGAGAAARQDVLLRWEQDQ